MDSIIAKLLSNKPDEIASATVQLNAVLHNPETIAQLCQLLQASPDVPVRQYAAILLKKRIKKLSLWRTVAAEQQQSIKGSIVEVLANEPAQTVRSLIAQIIGMILRFEHDSPANWMHNVLQFVVSYINSADAQHVEIGSHALAVFTETAPDQFKPYIVQICEMFFAAVNAHEANGTLASPIVCNLVDALTNMIMIIVGINDAEQAFAQAIPPVLKTLKALVVLENPERFTQAFEFLESMADFTPKLLNNHVRALVEFCLEVGLNQSLPVEARNKSISYVGWLVRIKKKQIIKLKLLEGVVTHIFNIMCSEPENPESEGDYFINDHGSGAVCAASQSLDVIALNVSSEKLMPIIVALINQAVQSEDPQVRCGGYLAISVIAEGCSEAICSKYIESFLQLLKNGILDDANPARNAAFFALGQFAEHLQPDISKYAPEVLPILFQYLENLCNEVSAGGNEPKHMSRMFYALENLCENLEKDLVPYLPILMERLTVTLNPKNSVQLRELGLSATAAVATATKEHLLPYFKHLIEILRTYLAPTEDENILEVRPQAIDTLAALARNIGIANFQPLAEETMTFALNLLEEADDSTMRRALYNLIASLAEIESCENMSKVFPRIMEPLIESITSTTRGDSSDDEATDDNAEIDIGDDTSSEDEDIAVNVLKKMLGPDTASHLDEKQEAILAIKHFADHNQSFMPYLYNSYELLYKLLDDIHEDLRRTSIEALASVVPAIYIMSTNRVNDEVKKLMPKLMDIILNEEDSEVVVAAIDCVAEIIKKIKAPILPTKELRDKLFNCIIELLRGNAACLNREYDSDDEEDDDSELESSVMENGGNLLPLFGGCMTPDDFFEYFAKTLAFLLKKLRKIKNSDEYALQRAFIYGVLGDSFKSLAQFSANFFEELKQVFIQGINDKHAMARQNAVFALGELVFHSGEPAYPAYANILQTLSIALNNEKSPAALDNICGAVARLIIRNHSIIPLAQVLPALFAALPLREDFDENATMFKCFKTIMFQVGEPANQHGDALVISIINVLYKKQCDDETFQDGVSMLQTLRAHNVAHFDKIVSTQPEIVEFLKTILFV